MPESLLSFEFSLSRTAVVLVAVLALAVLDLVARLRNRDGHMLFAAVLGTILAVGLIKVTRVLLQPGVQENGHVVALGVLLILVMWRMLFGAWEAEVKATVLGTFIVWVGVHLFWRQPEGERLAYLFAVVVALIPAVIWCTVFLAYHAQRRSVVLLMFFAGVVATMPVLFYDALVRHGVELQFFLLRIVPESFSATTESFIASQLLHAGPVQTTLVTLIVSFIFVGLIEEFSKYWVIQRSGEAFLHSIDDALQLGIVVAIGFAFAENVANPSYFVGFVREYLSGPGGHPDWAGFLGNVAGRSILTSMVHIVSTGVMGYFFGLAVFAEPIMREGAARGIRYRIVTYIHDLFGVSARAIFRREMILTGLVCATGLHALSNFLVTFPDVLPGNPRTFGALLGSPAGSLLNGISLLLVPSLLYVVGGFWLLTFIFERKENMKERGHVVTVDTFVREEN